MYPNFLGHENNFHSYLHISTFFPPRQLRPGILSKGNGTPDTFPSKKLPRSTGESAFVLKGLLCTNKISSPWSCAIPYFTAAGKDGTVMFFSHFANLFLPAAPALQSKFSLLQYSRNFGTLTHCHIMFCNGHSNTFPYCIPLIWQLCHGISFY